MNQTKDMTNDRYNIAATPTITELPIAPKASNWKLLSCGIQWAVISGIVAYCVRNNQDAVVWAVGAVLLALTVATLGLVWGVFQHVLKTIVRIVRTGN